MILTHNDTHASPERLGGQTNSPQSDPLAAGSITAGFRPSDQHKRVPRIR